MAKIYVKACFGIKSDSLENWLHNNPILEDGEPSYVKDAESADWLKIGDGVSRWSDLPFRYGPDGKKGEDASEIIQTTPLAASLNITDSSDKPMVGLKVIGKTFQDGTPSPDSPQPIQCVKKGTKIKLTGKNLLNLTFRTTTVKGLNFKNNGDGSVTINGTPTDYADVTFGWIDRVDPKAQYIISPSLVDTGLKYVFDFRDINNNRVGWGYSCGGVISVNGGLYDKAMTIPEGTVSMGVRIKRNFDNVLIDNYTLYPQLEIGNQSTAYNPYVLNEEITVPCDLYEGDIWYPLSGKVEKYNEILSIGNNFRYLPNTNHPSFVCSVKNKVKGYGSSFKSQCFRGRNYPYDALNADWRVGTSSGQKDIYLTADSTVTTIEQLLERIGTDKYVVYQLETPIIEQYEPYPKLYTNKLITNIFNSEAVELNADIEAQYVADTKTYIDDRFTALTQAIISLGGNV